MTERISAPVARSLGSRTHRGRWDRSCRGIMVASASHARSLAQVLEKWAPIFRSWGTGCGGRRHARARHAAPDQAERDTTPHGFSALDLEAAACCVTVLAAALFLHRLGSWWADLHRLFVIRLVRSGKNLRKERHCCGRRPGSPAGCLTISTRTTSSTRCRFLRRQCGISTARPRSRNR